VHEKKQSEKGEDGDAEVEQGEGSVLKCSRRNGNSKEVGRVQRRRGRSKGKDKDKDKDKGKVVLGPECHA
jgi:hypothetical protein